MTSFNINLHELVYSLSDALDLVGVVQVHHGKRVAFMAVECGKALGLPTQQLDRLFQAAMLHDCGVSNTAVHARLAQFEWEDSNHCIAGERMMASSPIFKDLAPLIRYHHTHWPDLQALDLSEEDRLLTNCIFMVDRVDVLSLHAQLKDPNLLMGFRNIQTKISNKRNFWFAPQWVDAFLTASKSEAFWLSLEREHVDDYMQEWISHVETCDVSFESLKSIVGIFSHIVDAKSEFTCSHSDGVANLARYLGELFELPIHQCDQLELAGLLHDIGKLRVPDEILDKPSKLSEEEYRVIQRHSFDSASILKNIKGLENIAKWSGQHHERLDGEGYPFHNAPSRISLEARILAVSDVFQALAQKRPYRDSLSPDKVLAILDQDVERNQLDPTVVEMVRNNLQECYRVATTPR